MKANKLLFLIAFVLLVAVLMLSITGLAVAAPAAAVKGDVTFVDWVFGPFIEDTATGTWVWPDNVITWMLSGDLVGTYTMFSTYSGKIGALPDRITGTATFVGTLNGRPIVWSATLKGSGKSDPAYDFAGRNYWKSTLFDGGKGQITIHQFYAENADPLISYSDAMYWGELK
jgi:hypothetical protein